MLPITSIDIKTVHEHLTGFPGVFPQRTWGEISYFCNPGQVLKRGTYFATVKDKDGDNDRGSHLNRKGVWRLNIGVQKDAYISLFGPLPARPSKGEVIDGPWDFATLDQIMPHPVYGWMGWVAVLSPSQNTWEPCHSLLEDAYARAQRTFNNRKN